MPELSNPQNTPEPDGATLTIESNSDAGTLYSYSKTTPFTGTEADAAEIMANGVGQAPVVGTNTRVVTGQDPLTDHYAGWVQDSDGYGDGMVLVFNIATDGETLTIPGGAGTYLFDIDWGDGTPVETGLTTVGAGPHTYTDANPETVVRISGVFPHINFNNAGDIGKLIRILQLGDVGATNYSAAFQGGSNVIELVSGVVNTSLATSGFQMFRDVLSVQTPPKFDSWDTSNFTSFRGLLMFMRGLTQGPDLSPLDTRNVTNIQDMLRGLSAAGAFDPGIDKWQIPKLTVATNFMLESKLTTAAYDRTLASWGNQTLAAGALSTTIHFGSSTYTDADSKNLLLDQVAGIVDAGAFDTNTPIWLAATSEFLATGAGSHEMKAQLVGTGTPTFTHSGLLLPDHEGVYREVPANTAPWHGARWDNGVPYDDDGTGTPLAVAPSLYAAPALTNAVLYSNDLTSVEWLKTDSPDITFDQVGLTGEPNTASLVADNSAAVFCRAGQPAHVPFARTVLWVLKTTEVDNYPGIQCNTINIIINTKDGTAANFGALTVETSIVGDWLYVYIEAPAGTGTDGIYGQLSSDGTTNDATATGEVIVGNVSAFHDKTIPEVRGAAPIITAGATVTNDAVLIDYDVKNHRDAFGGYYLEVTQQAAGGMLSSFLSVVGSNIQLSDGTTTATSAWVTDTTYKIGVAYGSSMALCVDGVWSADLSYDNTLVSGALDLFRSATGTGIARNIQRYELEFADAKAKIEELMA